MVRKWLILNDILLLLASVIWGFAFVAQRVGMQHIGPFTFNAIRFAIGGLALFPVITYLQKSKLPEVDAINVKPHFVLKYGSWLLGVVLFIASSFQQVGIVYTTGGNAGFITGLYVIFVPLFGLLWGKKTGLPLWIGALLAVAGLSLLSLKSDLSISKGDLLVLAGAFFWGIHVSLVGYLSPKLNALKLARNQFLVCSLLSLIVALIWEHISIASLCDALIPLLYGGFLSVAVAFTIQIIAQKKAHPSHAAIILNLETVFAALGGWIILHETMTLRAMAGCLLMICGMLYAQLKKQTLV
jgi:drug/metabolite transporter (DMT)-like permease